MPIHRKTGIGCDVCPRPFWGDLHNHNEVGYGWGSLAHSYAVARAMQLDVYAFTPHAWWHDLPEGDPQVAEKHRRGFQLVRDRWEEVRRRADEEYQPGRFVSFPAFEWHSSRYGDYHVLLPDSGAEICRAETLGELQSYARAAGAILIPHHLAYRQGWRGIDWRSWSADVSPVADGFSEHASSIEADTHWHMHGHSMGGSERSQTIVEQWKRGRVMGLVASTDNHWGCPASYSEGLAGIWAEQLTRKSVLEALRRRHTYAVSGDRIQLRWESPDGMMGDILAPEAARELHCAVEALGAIDYIEALKNGRRFALESDSELPAKSGGEYLCRVEFGWDGLGSRKTTDWQIELRVDEGELIEILPCFAGGEGSTEEISRITGQDRQRAGIFAYTSRLNSRPTSGVIVRLEGSPATKISLEVSANHGGAEGGARLQATLGELAGRTAWAAISPSFSAPRISLGSGIAREALRREYVFRDAAGKPGDFYTVKVQQKNGQTAWSSPIWFGEPTPHEA